MAATAIGMLAVMAGATEWLLRSQVEPQDSWLPHLRLVQAPRSRDLAFGDSHMARGFSAPTPWVNLAYPSSTVEQMAATVAEAIADETPERVIVQADPHLFAPYRLRRGPGANEPALSQSPTEPFALLADARHRPQLASYWRTFLAEGGTLRSQIERTPSGALLSPGNLAALPARRLAYEALTRARVHQPLPGFRAQPAAAAYHEMVAGLLAAGTDVCMVALPVSAAYSAALTETAPAGQPFSYDEVLTWFAATAAELGATFIDHRRAITDPALFRDVDHLNREGALAYADQLLAACAGEHPTPVLSASEY